MEQTAIQNQQNAVTDAVDAAIKDTLGDHTAYAAIVAYMQKEVGGANILAIGSNINQGVADIAATMASAFTMSLTNPEFFEKIVELVREARNA